MIDRCNSIEDRTFTRTPKYMFSHESNEKLRISQFYSPFPSEESVKKEKRPLFTYKNGSTYIGEWNGCLREG